jgi:two-component system chemotaxis sensor kinase CheA
MHLLRNAIDHGIEPSDVRVQQGKSPTATIYLRGYQTSTSVVIEVQDDGRGLDLAQIKQTAIKRGICREEDLATMTPNQIQSLIFSPGFSTAPLVTEVSGRGVGLDVVQTNVEKLKGNLQIESTPGKGCLFRISLGITLATAHVLIVQVEGMPYAIPVGFVKTACFVDPDEPFPIKGRDTILRDDRPISVVKLSDLLELSPAATPGVKPAQKSCQLACVILQVGQEHLGVFVDALIDEQDVVIKPQSKLLQRVRNVAGATILGTGEVCMVLHPPDLIQSARHCTQSTVSAPSTPTLTQKTTILLVEDSIATRTQEKRILETAGFEVITAVDGMDGFNKLQSRSVDAIVSDVQMPNMDGLGLAARIRQHKEYDDLPIILVTSLSSDEDKRRGAEVGANAYITKGNFNQDLLIETLQRLI